jgi:hypothetical protein
MSSKKYRKIHSKTYLYIFNINFSVRKLPDLRSTYFFSKNAKSFKIAQMEKFRPGHPGVDVMITIFCDFFPIFGEKYWRFSQKPIV